MADLILPWMVQRFTPLLHFEMNRYRDHIMKDTEWCERNGVGYVPLVYPGFSWYNLSRGGSDANDIGGEKPLASIPRQGGKFYWDQIYTRTTVRPLSLPHRRRRPDAPRRTAAGEGDAGEIGRRRKSCYLCET